MKTGRTIQEVMRQVRTDAESAVDVVMDTRNVSMRGGLIMEDRADPQAPAILRPCAVRELAHGQIANRLQVPKVFYDRLRSEHPDMLDYTVSELLHRTPERRMLRTLVRNPEARDGELRAFLSDRYRRFDNWQVAEAVLPVLHGVQDLQFLSSEVTERRMYLKAVFPRIQGDVKPGDPVQAGILISNSEIGGGSTEVAMLLYRLVCRNGAVVEDLRSRRYHVGRRVGGGGDEELEGTIFSDATLRADDTAYSLKLRDLVRAVTDGSQFPLVLAKAREAAGDVAKSQPQQVAAVLVNKLALTEKEGGSLLEHLCGGGDFSRWGIANAITRTSQDVEDYDRATELERAGGSLLDPENPIWVAARG